MNPAVTLAMATLKKCKWIQVSECQFDDFTGTTFSGAVSGKAGKAGKAAALPRFFKIESGGGSGGAPPYWWSYHRRC